MYVLPHPLTALHSICLAEGTMGHLSILMCIGVLKLKLKQFCRYKIFKLYDI